jgi:molybdopterin-containing oxidoreductase family membrane subunit
MMREAILEEGEASPVSHRKGLLFYSWIALLLVFIAVGVYVGIYQWRSGLLVTGMRNIISWGLYISSSVFFIGMGAGCLMISASSYVFSLRDYRPLAKMSVLLSLTSMTVAGIYIGIDLGRPERFLKLFLSPSSSSPLLWEFVLTWLLFLLSLFYLFLITREKIATKDNKRVFMVAILVLIGAIMLIAVDAKVFGLQMARPFWHGVWLIPLFFSSALISGLSLIILVSIILNKFTERGTDPDLIISLAKTLAFIIPLELFFLACHILTSIYLGDKDMAQPSLNLLGGGNAYLFWLEIIAGGLIPFLILIWSLWKKSTFGIMATSLLALMGMFLNKYNLIIAGLTYPLIQLPPGSPLGVYQPPPVYSWAITGRYSPSWLELGLSLGIVAFGIFFFMLFVPFLYRDNSVE